MKKWKTLRDAIREQVARDNCIHESSELIGTIKTGAILGISNGRMWFMKDILLDVYQCPNCKKFKVFGTGRSRVSCLQEDKLIKEEEE